MFFVTLAFWIDSYFESNGQALKKPRQANYAIRKKRYLRKTIRYFYLFAWAPNVAISDLFLSIIPKSRLDGVLRSLVNKIFPIDR